MDINLPELENIRKKCAELDNELDAFFRSIKGIRAMSDSFPEVPVRLKENKAEIENLKKEMKGMEKRLRELFFTKLERQKYIILSMLAVMIAGAVFFFFYLNPF
ncbi:MAG: hypothetical protein C4526_10455 [Nitrospiraceae bacterium]|nr:MAG: hypothetical protein C4526_10455 [Nitrospiraceae bacterium]